MNEAGNVLVNFEMPDKDGEQTKEVEIQNCETSEAVEEIEIDFSIV